MEEIGFKKVVFKEEGNEIKTVKGKVVIREDNLVVVNTHNGSVWINKGNIVSIKDMIGDDKNGRE